MVVTTTVRGEEIQENFAQIAKYVVMFLKTYQCHREGDTELQIQRDDF